MSRGPRFVFDIEIEGLYRVRDVVLFVVKYFSLTRFVVNQKTS